MSQTTPATPNVKQTVPLLNVTDLSASLRFFVDGLEFRMTNRWEPDGRLRWCWLQLGDAALMLQEIYADEHHEAPRADCLGQGLTICFMCDDALSIYRQSIARGMNPKEPFVGNGLWVVSYTDPDGYRIDFESPTDVPEETLLSQWERSHNASA